MAWENVKIVDVTEELDERMLIPIEMQSKNICKENDELYNSLMRNMEFYSKESVQKYVLQLDETICEIIDSINSIFEFIEMVGLYYTVKEIKELIYRYGTNGIKKETLVSLITKINNVLKRKIEMLEIVNNDNTIKEKKSIEYFLYFKDSKSIFDVWADSLIYIIESGAYMILNDFSLQIEDGMYSALLRCLALRVGKDDSGEAKTIGNQINKFANKVVDIVNEKYRSEPIGVILRSLNR